MKTSIRHYRWMTAVAAVLLLCLIAIQMIWLKQAKALDAEQQHLQLLRTVPELALAIDDTHRDAFHQDDSTLARLTVQEVESVIDSFMNSRGYQAPVFFAIYQDTTDGLFLSNGKQYKKELLSSEYRHCLSCIIRFMIGTSEDNLEEINPELTISRPVSNYVSLPGSPPPGEVIYLSIHIPSKTSGLIRSLTGVFILSVVLLAFLILLFFYLLKTFSKHKKMSEVKVDFFNNLNHEFKTPLSSIHLASRVLRQSKDDKKNETYLDLIERESKSLEERLTRVLELSLIDHGNVSEDKEKVSMHKVILKIVDRLQIQADKISAIVNTKLLAKNDVILGQKRQLNNCIYNVLENALKYGGQDVEIEIQTKEVGGKLEIIIQDNGPGIDRKYQRDVFERFVRGQQNDQYKGQGFGIGLSYVKAVIESHGGTVRINPNYQEGTEIIIVL